MLSYIRPGDDPWAVPVVLYIVWSGVLLVSTCIVLSCLKRETKKFEKRLARIGKERENQVGDLARLDSLAARYVQLTLTQGALQRLAGALSRESQGGELEIVRGQIRQWFQRRVEELSARNFKKKESRRLVLAAVRRGLTQHPLDLRGSRRALEAAQIFLELDGEKKEGVEFLDTTLTIGKADQVLEAGGGTGGGSGAPSFVCPTMPCQWLASTILRLASLAVSHQNTIPLFFVFLSFVIWLYDCITDMVIIEKLWSFQLPILQPDLISYQTLTIDLYAPLLLLVLLFSLMFTLLSCSCSRLSDQYRLATDHARPQTELRARQEDPTTIMARYDFHLSQAVTASLPQFVLQFSAYMLVLYMLEALKNPETLKGLTETESDIQQRIDNFSFASLWFSGLGSGLSLVIAQYTAFKIQHEHDMTLTQRIVYFLACCFNTVAMMTSCVVFVMLVFLPCSSYVGRYHIMAIIILGAALLLVATLVSITLAIFGLDASSFKADRVISKLQSPSLLTGFLRFSQTSPGQWSSLLGSVTMLGKVISLPTINLFLPPSQLLVHPFNRFYATSPRSPAVHYAIAKHLTIYNLLHIISSIVLAVDINSYGFNYSLTPATRNLLVYANITGVPCLFLSLFILFKFYSSHDLWTSHGVHLVYVQDLPTVLSPGQDDAESSRWQEETRVTVLQTDDTMDPTMEETEEGSEPEANSEVIGDETPQAESTTLGSGGEADPSVPLNSEQDDSAEADRNHTSSVKKPKTKASKLKKVTLQRTTAALQSRMRRSCCTLVADVATVEVGNGRWVDVSD